MSDIFLEKISNIDDSIGTRMHKTHMNKQLLKTTSCADLGHFDRSFINLRATERDLRFTERNKSCPKQGYFQKNFLNLPKRLEN